MSFFPYALSLLRIPAAHSILTANSVT